MHLQTHFKNKENQKQFLEETSKNTRLLEVFNTEDIIHVQTEKFMKQLDKIIHKCFQKIRRTVRKESEYETLYGECIIWHNDDENSKAKTIEIEKELADRFAENIFERIKEQIKGIK